MPGAAENCPYCGHEVDVERQDVGDGLLACDYCGELFNRRTALPSDLDDEDDKHDIIGSLFEKAAAKNTPSPQQAASPPPPPPPALHAGPEDTLSPIVAANAAAPPAGTATSAVTGTTPGTASGAARITADAAGEALARPAPALPAPRRGRMATAGWTVGILLLLCALAVQFAYFMRDDLARHAALRPMLLQLCAYAGCEIPLLRAPEQIRMVARDIRRHQTARDALRVSLTFANDADFAQAYPTIQLRFFDMRDRVLAERRFTPEEYLPQNIDMASGIPARGALQAVIEIGDPGADAVNFTFDFL